MFHILHFVRSLRILSYSGPYSFQMGKIRIRIIPNTDTFYTVIRSNTIKKILPKFALVDVTFWKFKFCWLQLALPEVVTLHKRRKFSVKDFLIKCHQIHRKLRIWLYLLNGKLHFLCSVSSKRFDMKLRFKWFRFLNKR